MEIKLKKWFVNGDKTRYKVVLPASNFVKFPEGVKEVYFSANIQVVKDDSVPGTANYMLTLFGENRVQWLKDLGIKTTGLSWRREVLNKKVMPLEIIVSNNNALTKPMFRNLTLA